MIAANYRFIGRGAYSLTEAERIAHVPRQRMRRWLEGYHFVASGKRHRSPPVVISSVGRDVGELSLTFDDLMEVRFLDAFLRLGVSWPVIRIAAVRARKLLNRSHPFSSRLFKTDGKNILAEIAGGSARRDLLNLVNNQWEISQVVLHTLFTGIEFGADDSPERWWPSAKKGGVAAGGRIDVPG